MTSAEVVCAYPTFLQDEDFEMESLNTVAEVLIRLTIVLAVGWVGLSWAARRNPRWSVAVTRWMIVACAGLPILHACLPSASLAILPRGGAENTAQETTEARLTRGGGRGQGQGPRSNERACGRGDCGCVKNAENQEPRRSGLSLLFPGASLPGAPGRVHGCGVRSGNGSVGSRVYSGGGADRGFCVESENSRHHDRCCDDRVDSCVTEFLCIVGGRVLVAETVLAGRNWLSAAATLRAAGSNAAFDSDVMHGVGVAAKRVS
jgi:hypothetical protein